MVISIVIVMGCAKVVGSYCVEPKCTGMPYDVVSWSGGSSASIPSRGSDTWSSPGRGGIA
jgi:hypothetical protein